MNKPKIMNHRNLANLMKVKFFDRNNICYIDW